MKSILEYNKRNREQDKYIYVDSIENPIDSLESCLLFLDRKDTLKWKWIIIALGHSLFHFCIANLQGTNYEEVLTTGFGNSDKNIIFKRGEDPWKKSRIVFSENKPLYKIEWDIIDYEPTNTMNINLNKNIPKKRNLIGFWSALARVQDNQLFMGRYMHSKNIELSDYEEGNIVQLNHYRNLFSHFIPTLWGIDVEILRNISLCVIDVIKRLSLETFQILYHDRNDRERITTIIEILKMKLIV